MDEKEPQTTLVSAQADLQVALRGAVSLWASATTSECERRADLLRDKQRIVLSLEKPVERIFKDFSTWEANGFAEYCGSDPKGRPDRLSELYEEHKRFERGKHTTCGSDLILTCFEIYETYQRGPAAVLRLFEEASARRPERYQPLVYRSPDP